MPRVSVVIPVFNRARCLGRAIDSVLDQDFKDIELIVVDDGSTDDTRKILQGYGDRVRSVFQENQGPGAARNNGVGHATGEWIAFLDSDDVWLPQKLGRQLEWADANEVDLCFHNVVRPADAAEPRGNGGPINGAGRKAPDLAFSESAVLGDSFGLLIEAAHIFLTTTLLLRRGAFMNVGGMSPDLLTNQDIDLYLRLFPRYRVGCLAESLAVYSPGQNRAFEVASAKARHAGERGGSRVHLDRLRAYARAYEDRMAHSDPARADMVRRGMLKTTRLRAGLCRRNGDYSTAAKAYACYFALRAIPSADPGRFLAWQSIVNAPVPKASSTAG
jgi:glycosyltransferase involved in cell wall biosynthesis